MWNMKKVQKVRKVLAGAVLAGVLGGVGLLAVLGLCRLISRAARAAEEVGSMVTTLGFISSLTCMKITAFPVKFSLQSVCPIEQPFIL